MLLLPPQSRPPPKNPLPARFFRGAFIISVCFCPIILISYILYLISIFYLTDIISQVLQPTRGRQGLHAVSWRIRFRY